MSPDEEHKLRTLINTVVNQYRQRREYRFFILDQLPSDIPLADKDEIVATVMRVIDGRCEK